MISRLCILFVAALLLGFTPYDAERKDLTKLIPRFISLLETGKTVEFLKIAVCESDKPELLKHGLDKLAAGFEKERKDRLVTILKLIKDKTPTYSADGMTAEYKFDKSIGAKNSIVFAKDHGFWCIKN